MSRAALLFRNLIVEKLVRAIAQIAVAKKIVGSIEQQTSAAAEGCLS